MNVNYALASQGVFRTIQGEGVLFGTPMVFVRLAGCPVGCADCDTDYRVARRVDLHGLLVEIAAAIHPLDRWAWITGGEPMTQNISPLVQAIRLELGLRVAVATSGHFLIPTELRGQISFLSVSPHRIESWVVRYGEQLNLVPGLNGLRMEDFHPHLIQGRFCQRAFLTPLHGDEQSLQTCIDWVFRHPELYRLGIQAHKHWRLP